MKVLMLNTFDEVGGAARSAVRLLRGVRGLGIDGRLLVQFRTGKESHVICHDDPLRKSARRLKILLGLLPVRLYPNKPENNFSPALLPDHLVAEVAPLHADIIHLHWLGAGFLKVESLGKLAKPLIWTLHDSWAFTGGCHVPFDCRRYRQSCGKCPVLGSSRERDLSRRTWKRKAAAWRGLDLTVVAPSRWLADCARSSSLFGKVRVEVIPNGLDIGTFHPWNKEQARHFLGLPKDRKIILFGAVRGASDPNKGFRSLQSALQTLGGSSSDVLALLFGSSHFAAIPRLGMPVLNLGKIRDNATLAAAYSAADVFVAPSRLENFPNTILEAMACGTACVAFRQGGVPELIEHEVSGYLARPCDTDDLARGISWVLEDGDRRATLSFKARRRVEAEFDIRKIAERYIALYREILQQ